MTTKKEKIQQLKQLLQSDRPTQAQLAVIQKYGGTISGDYTVMIFDNPKQRETFKQQIGELQKPLICVTEN